MAGYDCRNNRLARRGLAADGFEDAIRSRIARHGARRAGIVLGTSTSGILSTELAYRQRAPKAAPARRAELPAATAPIPWPTSCALAGLEGPACVVSTACSSSAKAYAARRG
jgi:3-oxoacyl-[acyl-carrier-protein] synthase-1